MIRQRMDAGLRGQKQRVSSLGGRDPALEKRIQSQLRTGKGVLKIAVGLGVGSATVQRVKREMKEGRPFANAQAA